MGLESSADDVLILPIDGDEATGWRPGKPRLFLNSRAAERAPMFSPDGKWLAYQSTESGIDEIYVQSYPGPGGKWLISTGGGITPTWSRTKNELFYASPQNQIMVVDYTIDASGFHAGRPRLWSTVKILPRRRTGPTRFFDLHPDGTRFVLAPASDAPAAAREKFVFVVNFFDELRQRVPIGK